jgi:hypothetical protein
MDPGYTPPNRGSLVTDRTLQVPPPGSPGWQPPNYRPGALTYRNPSSTPGSVFGAQPNPPLASAAPYGDPFQTAPSTPAPLAQSSPFGSMQPGAQQGFPVPTAQPPTPPAPLASSQTDTTFPPIQQVGFQEQAPLRVVSPDTLPQKGFVRNSSTPGALPEMPKPLLMAANDTGSKPVEMASLPPAPRTMPLPGQLPMATDPPMPAHPKTLMLPADDKETSPAPSKVEEKTITPTIAAKQAEGKTEASKLPPSKSVNSKRVVLNYKLDDVGPSGVSSVELWFTRDGRTWHKDEKAVKSGPPYVIEVEKEGMYGFTLVAKNGVGVGKQPPQSGDLPQIWVDVDLTPPTVKLMEVTHGVGSKVRDVTYHWTASDRNMARRPITLSYAERPEGPWLPLAANIENSGKHTTSLPKSCPPSFYARVEAVDTVGNVGSDQSSKPTSIDLSQPTVSILGVEAGEK